MATSNRNDHFQDLTVAGNVSLSATTIIEGNLLPDTADGRTLGDATHKWADLYVANLHADSGGGGGGSVSINGAAVASPNFVDTSEVAFTNPSGATVNAALKNSSIANARLANSSLTVTAGSGLTGGGSVALGASTTLSVPTNGITNAMIAGSIDATKITGTASVVGHTHAASAITSGQLAAAQGGLAADASAFTGMLKMTAGVASVATAGTDYMAPRRTIEATDPTFSLPQTGYIFCDASFTNGSNVVTIANDSGMNDRTFTSSNPNMVGWTVFATNDKCANAATNPFGGSIGVKIALGTISSVDSTTQIHVSNNATATCTSSSGNPNCTLVIVPADSQAALNAAWAATVAPGVCGTLHLPAGVYAVSAPIQDTTSGCGEDNASNGTFFGAFVYGEGREATTIVPLPSFNASTCNSNAIPYGCFFAMGNGVSQNPIHLRDFGIYGAGNFNVTGSGPAKYAIYLGANAMIENVGISKWGIGNGFACNGANAALCIATDLNVLEAGSNFLAVFGGNTGFGPVNYCTRCNFTWAYGGQGAMQIVAPTNTRDSSYTEISAGRAVQVATTGAIWNSWGDTIVQSNTNSTKFIEMVHGQANLNELNIGIEAAGNTNTGIDIASGATVTCKNCKVALVSTGSKGLNNAGTFVDLGGNSITGATNVAGSGAFYGTQSITGTAQTTGNIALTSGWDTSTKSAISGNTKVTQWTVTAAGTPGASPVITVTFPTPFWATPICSIAQVAGTFGTLTNPVISGTSTTSTAITWSGTPVATQTYTFVLSCDNP